MKIIEKKKKLRWFGHSVGMSDNKNPMHTLKGRVEGKEELG